MDLVGTISRSVPVDLSSSAFEQDNIKNDDRHVEVDDGYNTLTPVEGVHNLIPPVSNKVLENSDKSVLKVIHVDKWWLACDCNNVVRVKLNRICEELQPEYHENYNENSKEDAKRENILESV